MNEFKIIESFKSKQNLSSKVICGIGDDTAVLKYSKTHHQLITKDVLVEGVHFTRSMGAKWIGHKALACNMSDIAAMGGLPTQAVIGLVIPNNVSTSFIKACFDGMYALAKKFHISLIGGDTVQGKQLMISVTLLGEVKKNHLIKRSEAKVGDAIVVTGALGKSFKNKKHLNFIPRVKEAQLLVKHFKPTSMIDLSDGLAGDIRHILQASQVGAILEAANIPLNKGATLRQALSDGEDYELLFTLDANKAKRLVAKHKGFSIIGQIFKAKQGLKIRDEKGDIKELKIRGYEHL